MENRGFKILRDMIERKKYKPGVDFIIPAYDIRTFDYIKVCVASIQKYWNKIPYTIHVVVNYEIEEEVDQYRNYFKHYYSKDLQDILPYTELNEKMMFDIQDPNQCIKVVKGVDQSGSVKVSGKGGITQQVGTTAPGFPIGVTNGLIDNNGVAAGSWYGAFAFNEALKGCDREYVCAVHEDSIFTSENATSLLSILDKGYYKFISNRWCPGRVFKVGGNMEDDGMARCMVFLCKRELYDEIEAQDYVEKGIWTSSPWNCDFRDMTGNMTWYAKEKGYPFLILTNSFEDIHRAPTYLKDQHLLKITESLHDTEQAWVDGIPIWFHHGRGGYRPTRCLEEWIRESTNYLKSNKGIYNEETKRFNWS